MTCSLFFYLLNPSFIIHVLDLCTILDMPLHNVYKMSDYEQL